MVFSPLAITSSLFPAIINAKLYQKEDYFQRLQKLYDLMVWIAVAIALPTAILSPWIVELLYGNEYLESSSVYKKIY